MTDRSPLIFHGRGAHPDVVWLPWLRDRLLTRGYAVEVPHYPGLDVEPISSNEVRSPPEGGSRKTLACACSASQ